MAVFRYDEDANKRSESLIEKRIADKFEAECKAKDALIIRLKEEIAKKNKLLMAASAIGSAASLVGFLT